MPDIVQRLVDCDLAIAIMAGTFVNVDVNGAVIHMAVTYLDVTLPTKHSNQLKLETNTTMTATCAFNQA